MIPVTKQDRLHTATPSMNHPSHLVRTPITVLIKSGIISHGHQLSQKMNLIVSPSTQTAVLQPL